jgi:hypothetical protein
VIDQPTARLMRKVAPPPAETLMRRRSCGDAHAETLMRPRDNAPSSLPFTPCVLLIRILAHTCPDGRRIQVGTRLFDLLGEHGANGLMDSEGHLMRALDFAQFVFLGAEEAWVFEGIAHAGHGKDLQAHVNADFLTRRRQRRRFPLARDGHKPLAGRRAANRRGLRHAFQWALGARRWALGAGR